jgi:hypothetical protein
VSNELKTPYESGNTLYACIRNDANQVLLISGLTFETWGTSGGASAYAISQEYDKGDIYVADFPAGVAAGHYYAFSYLQEGNSPKDSDAILLPGGEIWWDGTAEVPPASQDDVTDAHVTTDALIAALSTATLSVLNIYNDSKVNVSPGGVYHVIEKGSGGVYP